MRLRIGKHLLKDTVKKLSLLIGIEHLDELINQSKKLSMLSVDFLNTNTEGIVLVDWLHGYVAPITTLRRTVNVKRDDLL
jgi:hypothetical protein